MGCKLTRREFLVLGAGAGIFAVVGCSPTQRAEIVGESSTSNQSGIASSGQDHSEEGTLLVPVTHLTSAQENITSEELSQTKDLAVPQQLSGTVGELLGRSSDEFGNFDSTTAVVGSVSRTPGAVGLVPWDAVSSEVKALGVDGKTLLAPGASELENYPLASGTAAAPDPKKLRRIVVGGDIVLDRGQNYMVIQQNMGLNFPLDGGYAAVTGRTPEPSDASEFGIIHQFTAERQGGAGKVRDYLRNADLTLANFENPVIKDAVWHPDATTFTGDLQLLPELNQAGIGGVTLGNNHIMDAGVPGLEETLGHLDEAGISHAGAGMNQGVPSYEWSWASENNPGTTPLQEEVMKEDIKNLRPKVDFIIVMPHWGIEYTATPEPGQVEFAHAAMDAGADLLVGDHCHWPKGIEIYRGKPIFYGTGNFLFDQSWSEETSTGIFVEAILYEDRVVQARPVPFIVLDKAQPNFLVAEGGRDRALQTIFSTSLGPEFETYKASSNDRQPNTE